MGFFHFFCFRFDECSEFCRRSFEQREQFRARFVAIFHLRQAIDASGIDDFTVEGQEPIVEQWIADKEYKMGDIMNAWRLALVGIGKGPGMFDIAAFLGKEETLHRMAKAIETLG